ncbi:MAG TPA: HAD family hydrolase [Terriglobales bacterium]|jgi:D-glycero-D-manno-heptose 1,7-bisphosphate phosphatase
MENRPAVFLDRDGVINPMIYYADHGFVDSPFTLKQFSVLPHVPRAIRLLNDLGFAVVVASNQPGIAKGHFEKNLLRKIEEKTQDALSKAGARIDAFYYCIHHPQAVIVELRKRCACRKPGANLLRKAAREMKLSLANSYMIGDGLTDIEAGIRVGCKTIFVGRWKYEHFQFMHSENAKPNFIASDLWHAARLIEQQCHAQTHSSPPMRMRSTKRNLVLASRVERAAS